MSNEEGEAWSRSAPLGWLLNLPGHADSLAVRTTTLPAKAEGAMSWLAGRAPCFPGA